MHLASESRPEVLLLASKFDLSCDYVVAQLRKRGASYFRFNSEDFERFAISLIPAEPGVYLQSREVNVKLTPETLKAIYFRRGIYPREPLTDRLSVQEQLARSQLAAFMRSFMIFDSCRWVNHPAATYKAEQKAVQLLSARRAGLEIPRTVITNNPEGINQAANGDQNVAVKGLDTILVWQKDLETFGYTSLVETSFAERCHLSSAPLIAQEALEHKLDLRVTIVDEKVFCAAVTRGGNRIRGDWRLEKDDAEFQEYDLPPDIAEKCVNVTKSLGLVFGAVDLALQRDTYFFLEVNPTGEWAWLADQGRFPIDKAIADSLLCAY